jgi:hypothetical protein
MIHAKNLIEVKGIEKANEILKNDYHGIVMLKQDDDGEYIFLIGEMKFIQFRPPKRDKP